MNIHTLTTSLVDKYSLCVGLHFLCVCYFLILPQKWRFFVTQTTCTRDRKNLHKNSVDRISYLKFCRLTQLKYPPQLYIDFWVYLCYCNKYYHILDIGIGHWKSIAELTKLSSWRYSGLLNWPVKIACAEVYDLISQKVFCQLK